MNNQDKLITFLGLPEGRHIFALILDTCGDILIWCKKFNLEESSQLATALLCKIKEELILRQKAFVPQSPGVNIDQLIQEIDKYFEEKSKKLPNQ